MAGAVPEMRKASPPAYAPIPIYPASAPPAQAPVAEGRPYPAPAQQPAPSPSARAADLISGFKEQGKALICSQRPWPQLLDATALALPAGASDALARLRRNLTYFRSNYALAVVAALAVALLWHPASLVAFVVLVSAWCFLYFSRDQPIVLFGRAIDDGTALGVLSVATVLALVFSDVGSTVFGALMVGAVLVCLHAVFRATDDLFLDETEAASSGLVVPAIGIPAQPQAYVRMV